MLATLTSVIVPIVIVARVDHELGLQSNLIQTLVRRSLPVWQGAVILRLPTQSGFVHLFLSLRE